MPLINQNVSAMRKQQITECGSETDDVYDISFYSRTSIKLKRSASGSK